MKNIVYVVLTVLLYGCVPTPMPTNTSATNNNNNSVGNGGNGLNAGQPTNTCASVVLEGALQGGAGNSSGANGGAGSNSGTGNGINPNIAIGLLVPAGSSTYIPFCTYDVLNSQIPAGTTNVPFPASYDTLFIWEDGSHLADYISPATNGLPHFTGDIFQFLADSVTGFNAGGTSETFYLARNLPGDYTLTTADTSNFLSPAQANVCLNMNLYGNNFSRFSGGQIGYIAFRLVTLASYGGGYTYGWIKVSVDNTFAITVYEIGLNTVLNQPIFMGEIQ